MAMGHVASLKGQATKYGNGTHGFLKGTGHKIYGNGTDGFPKGTGHKMNGNGTHGFTLFYNEKANKMF